MGNYRSEYRPIKLESLDVPSGFGKKVQLNYGFFCLSHAKPI